MAKKMNSLAGDFEGISKAADSKVLALLTEDGQQKAEVKNQSVEKGTSLASNVDSQPLAHKPRRSGPTKSKPPKLQKLEDWGKPVAHFNTRIPEQMSESLNDLIYKLRKRGIHGTKQELAREALHDLLRKHSIC
ncbi:MAG: hypothetical protein AAGG48_26050 [Planctomycetota bacterium]